MRGLKIVTKEVIFYLRLRLKMRRSVMRKYGGEGARLTSNPRCIKLKTVYTLIA